MQVSVAGDVIYLVFYTTKEFALFRESGRFQQVIDFLFYFGQSLLTVVSGAVSPGKRGSVIERTYELSQWASPARERPLAPF